MSTTITTRLERRIEANRRGLTIIETIRGNMIQAALTPDEARQIAAALTADAPMVPARPVSPEERGELWARIRDELRGEYPSATDYDHRKLDIAASAAADAAIEWLNAHHPKPDPGAMSENYTPEGVDIVMRNLADARRERDAAVERAEQAERELAGSRDAHQRSADAHMEWKERALLAEDRLAVYHPEITRADVAEALGRCLDPEMWNVTFPSVVDEMCDLFGVEAEQAVDPVELLAGQIEDATRQAVREVIDALGKSVDTQAVEDSILATVGDDAQWLARHVLGQEADHA